MFGDYQNAIVALYEQKKTDKTLSQRLIHPTPANIRDECIEAVKTYVNKKDESTLNGFFGVRKDKTAYLQEIERYNINKFKPLMKFLKGSITKTDERNIELLALLLNFEPRPWDENGIFGGIKQGTNGVETIESVTTANVNKSEPAIINFKKTLKQNEVVESILKKKDNKRRKIIIAICMATVAIGGYFIWRISSRGNESCMYWTGDHFEKISCSKKLPNTILFPLDEDKANNFKKITRPDTITFNSIGKVWYTKSNNKIEFYTTDGVHPLNPNLELKRITPYIINKYILRDSASIN